MIGIAPRCSAERRSQRASGVRTESAATVAMSMMSTDILEAFLNVSPQHQIIKCMHSLGSFVPVYLGQFSNVVSDILDKQQDSRDT